MKNEGRVLAIAELIRGHGPRMAAQLIAEANAKHREMHGGSCGGPQCPVCRQNEET